MQSLDPKLAIWMKDAMPDELTNGQDVCAITVAYHPDATFPMRVERVSAKALQ